MDKKKLALHVVTNKKTVKGEIYQSVLLCHGYREGEKVKKKVLANLSALDAGTIAALKLQLKGERALFLANEDKPIDIGPGLRHGPILAIMTAIDRLDLPDLMGPKGRERDLVLAMIINRILKPSSRLTSTKWWSNTTLSNYLDIQDVDANDLYKAMDWLTPLQPIIEERLASRHLLAGDSIFYNHASTFMEDKTSPLRKFGRSHDKKRGKLKVNYGLL
ncbi:MAG: hypothetical protein LBT38_03320 [Deltaproteobacteria bacterium]|nr:hypothetical protein [Deltaproteobacteria bacterium]